VAVLQARHYIYIYIYTITFINLRSVMVEGYKTCHNNITIHTENIIR